jgi:hypothetical protein
MDMETVTATATSMSMGIMHTQVLDPHATVAVRLTIPVKPAGFVMDHEIGPVWIMATARGWLQIIVEDACTSVAEPSNSPLSSTRDNCSPPVMEESFIVGQLIELRPGRMAVIFIFIDYLS